MQDIHPWFPQEEGEAPGGLREEEAAAQPFAGDERILQVCRAGPFSFLVLVLCETEHPKP